MNFTGACDAHFCAPNASNQYFFVFKLHLLIGSHTHSISVQCSIPEDFPAPFYVSFFSDKSSVK